MGAIWNNFTQGIFDYGLSAFDSMEPWTKPLLFIAIIGFVYGYMQSATVAIVGIIITLSIYGTTTSYFDAVPNLTLFFYIVTLTGLSMLITALFISYWRKE